MAGVVKTFSWSELDFIPAVDIIIHLAGKAHDTKNQTDAQVFYFDINTGLTQTILDWFLTSDASKFIFFSSVKAAAENYLQQQFSLPGTQNSEPGTQNPEESIMPDFLYF